MFKSRVFNLELYTVPILQNHREFYGLRREFDESIDRWLKRAEICIRRCEFPTIIEEFLLFDRFVCGLNSAELRTIQSVSKSWTLNQLLDRYNYLQANNVNENQNIPSDMVKSEPVCLSLVSIIFQSIWQNLQNFWSISPRLIKTQLKVIHSVNWQSKKDFFQRNTKQWTRKTATMKFLNA